MSLLDDWIAFCKNPSLFSADHFANLFRECQSSDEIQAIYAPFNGGEIAASRLEVFFKENVNHGYWMPNEDRRASQREALEIAELFKADVVGLLAENNFNDLSDEIRALPINLSDNFRSIQDNRRRSDIIHADYSDFISDIFQNSYLVDIDIIVELKEALYQLSTSFDATRYLLSPLTSMPDYFNNAYSFWSKGCVYCFTNEKMEISILPGQKIS